MKQGLTAAAFAGLLERLAGSSDEQAERYEHLRRLLIRFFEWRRAPFPEEHADETLNRVAGKISDGLEIKNMSAYCHEVARFVFLEAIKGSDAKRDQLEDVHLNAVVVSKADEENETERRLACLDKCLERLPEENRLLIIEYYKNDDRKVLEHRRAISERLGLRRDALANRIQRLRNKLELCVKQCLRQ